ncbi:hypothetical protein RN001_003058 [Aquatica leii]|uniref:Uncharacterized protein n=1 Tax=Aquatica leii TaxID=1421715 RepID=A0AAN7SKI3_9COLE|nr:hypothetical protein RN001_003058 [Aquatica leii]
MQLKITVMEDMVYPTDEDVHQLYSSSTSTTADSRSSTAGLEKKKKGTTAEIDLGVTAIEKASSATEGICKAIKQPYQDHIKVFSQYVESKMRGIKSNLIRAEAEDEVNNTCFVLIAGN